jgi:hypothetical protein
MTEGLGRPTKDDPSLTAMNVRQLVVAPIGGCAVGPFVSRPRSS